MGNFNAKVGRCKVDGYVGEFGIGVRNERGDRLVEFCQSNNLVISNYLTEDFTARSHPLTPNIV